MTDEVLLPGFIVGGFRSFHGEPQFIGPLGKVTVVAGQNNDGKSNVLLAASKLLPSVQMTSTEWPFEDLDWPVDVESAPKLLTGIAVATSGSRAEALRRRLGNPDGVATGTNTYRALTELAEAPAFDAPNVPAGDLLWFRLEVAENKLAPESAQLDLLLQQTSNIIPLLENQLSLRSSPIIDLRNIFGHLKAGLVPPPVVLIPAIRAVTGNDGASGPELNDLAGLGLPQLLQALQSPRATRFREDSARFSRINRFLREVLQRPDAEILVPYDSETIHVSLGSRVLPLANLGTGISQLVLLATLATWHDRTLICLEEPELHLHPTLLRSLVAYLRRETSNQYLLTTHSAALLDEPGVTVFTTEYESVRGTTVSLAVTPESRAELAQRLGYRASDLLQANSIVWVEGPSDRVYVNHWIHKSDSTLREGVHYSVMFYGGRLLAHLTGEEMTTLDSRREEFVHLLRINRHMAIIIDSDKKTGAAGINETKQRIIAEFDAAGGFSWVTAGREIENYVPPDVLDRAIETVHPIKGRGVQVSDRRYSNVFADIDAPDKVRVAELAIADQRVWERHDLVDQMDALVAYIRAANHQIGRALQASLNSSETA